MAITVLIQLLALTQTHILIPLKCLFRGISNVYTTIINMEGCSFERLVDHMITISSFYILKHRKLHRYNYARAVCSNHLQNSMSPLHHCLCLHVHCPCCQRGKPLLTLWGLVCTKHTKNLWLRWWIFFLNTLSQKRAASLGMAGFKQRRQYIGQGAMGKNNGRHSAAEGQKYGCDWLKKGRCFTKTNSGLAVLSMKERKQ